MRDARAPDAGAPTVARPLRVAAIGVSTSRTCGVRDHAALLAGALEREHVECSLHWLWRTDRSIAAGHAQTRGWTQALGQELAAQAPEVVLLHYSVFAYSYRGLPLFVPRTLAALRDLAIPLVTVLHEYAYPWGRAGVRGLAWASSQRLLLRQVLGESAAVVVTADFRARWLATRAWLPRRPAIVSPVFSNLPPPRSLALHGQRTQLVGLFGYSYDGAAVSLMLDAFRLLKDRLPEVELVLLGAPGPASPAADEWRQAAEQRGVAGAISFSGRLSAQALSDALAGCDVLLSADPAGPTSRKTTLAASLASGRAVVALDGPRAWPELRRCDAALVVRPSPGALADAITGLLRDPGSRDALGARGAAFAGRAMGVSASANAVARLLGQVVGGVR